MPSDANHPSRRTDIEDWLDSRGVEWEFVGDHPLPEVDIEKGLNNQARVFTQLDEERVATYTEGVLRGDVFPGVVLKRVSRTKTAAVDGNHRLAAYLKATKPTIPAYIITKGKPQTLVMLTFEANVKHGLPTTHDERLHQAAWLIENGASEKQAAATVQIKQADVNKYWLKRKADNRAIEIGILRTAWDAISQSSRNRLSNISTDEGFKAAAELTFRANLTNQEVLDLVARLNVLKSSSRQEAMVKQFSSELGERIEQAGGGMATGGRRARTPKQVFNMALGQFQALPESPEIIAEKFIGEERPEAAKKARSAAEALSRIADLLESSAA